MIRNSAKCYKQKSIIEIDDRWAYLGYVDEWALAASCHHADNIVSILQRSLAQQNEIALKKEERIQACYNPTYRRQIEQTAAKATADGKTHS